MEKKNKSINLGILIPIASLIAGIFFMIAGAVLSDRSAERDHEYRMEKMYTQDYIDSRIEEKLSK